MTNIPTPLRAVLTSVLNVFWSRKLPLLVITAPEPNRICPLFAPVLPLQVVVPPRVRLRTAMSCKPLPVIDRPPKVLVTPLPLMVPPDQVAAPLTSSVPVPDKMPPLWLRVATLPAAFKEKVPLDSANELADVNAPLALRLPPETVTGLLIVAAPATVNAPLETTKASFEYKRPATCPAAFTVTIGLNEDRSRKTKSPAPGMVPPLQLAPTFQNSATLESLVQILMPAPKNAVSLRCRKNAPPTLPDRYCSLPGEAATAPNAPITVPPALMTRKLSPSTGTKPAGCAGLGRCTTLASAPALMRRLPLTLMAS